jgi:DNA-binding XRE family transcriptional regulator
MKKLDERHFKAMELLMKKRTQKEIAEEIGVSRMTIHRWMKDPLFESEFKHVLRNYSPKPGNCFCFIRSNSQRNH